MLSYHGLISVYLLNNKMTDEYWFTAERLYVRCRILSCTKIVIGQAFIQRNIYNLFIFKILPFIIDVRALLSSFSDVCDIYLFFLILFKFTACVSFIIRIYLFVGYFYRRNNLTIIFLKRIYFYWRDDSYASKHNKTRFLPAMKNTIHEYAVINQSFLRFSP